MTLIPGCYDPDELSRREQRFKELKSLYKVTETNIIIRSGSVEKTLTFQDGADISEMDALIYADAGNTCFGGTVTKKGNAYLCNIYTD